MEYLDEEEKREKEFFDQLQKSLQGISKILDGVGKSIDVFRKKHFNTLPKDMRNKIIAKRNMPNQDICEN